MKRWKKILLFGSILAIGSLLAMLTSVFIASSSRYPPPYWLLDFWALCLPFLIVGIIIMLLSWKIDKWRGEVEVKT